MKGRILKKAKTVLKDGEVHEINQVGTKSLLTIGDSRDLKNWADKSVKLVVTSPPFLNQVDYVLDSWIESWFCGINSSELEKKVVQTSDLDTWIQFISDTMSELHRVLVPGGILAMEVGEIRYDGELLNLDETVVSLTQSKKFNAGQFKVHEVYVQSQEFTKLANCFRVKNNVMGTNTNGIVLRKQVAQGSVREIDLPDEGLS